PTIAAEASARARTPGKTSARSEPPGGYHVAGPDSKFVRQRSPLKDGPPAVPAPAAPGPATTAPAAAETPAAGEPEMSPVLQAYLENHFPPELRAAYPHCGSQVRALIKKWSESRHEGHPDCPVLIGEARRYLQGNIPKTPPPPMPDNTRDLWDAL